MTAANHAMQSSNATARTGSSCGSWTSDRANIRRRLCLCTWLWLLAALCLWCPSTQGATATLYWDASLSATSYRVWQSVGQSSFSPTLQVSTNTAVVFGIATDQMTRWYVTALNAVGESLPSNVVTNAVVLPPPQLPTPVNLHAVRVQGNRWDLGWSSSLTAATEVERSMFPGPFARIETVAAGTQHTSIAANPKTGYAFRVRSVGVGGPSDYSNIVFVQSRN